MGALPFIMQYIPLTLTADAVMEVDPSICYMSDKDGMTALHHAAANDVEFRFKNIMKLVKIMLRHCPDCWEVTDHQGRNFLHIAAHNKNYHVLKFVLNEISSDLVADTILGMKDNNGKTPCQTFNSIVESNPRWQCRNWFAVTLNSYETDLNKQVRISFSHTRLLG